MKGEKILLGPIRSRYRAVTSRDALKTPRVSGGGIFEADPIERIDAATRREERHRTFEESRELVAVSVPESGGIVRRALRKLARVVVRGKKDER